MKSIKNQNGIAILMVISIIAILSSLTTGFLFQTYINHEMVIKEKYRAQAYYLAKSGINFSKLLLVYNKKMESQITSAGLDSSKLGALGYQPLYKMFPLS